MAPLPIRLSRPTASPGPPPPQQSQADRCPQPPSLVPSIWRLSERQQHSSSFVFSKFVSSGADNATQATTRRVATAAEHGHGDVGRGGAAEDGRRGLSVGRGGIEAGTHSQCPRHAGHGGRRRLGDAGRERPHGELSTIVADGRRHAALLEEMRQQGVTAVPSAAALLLGCRRPLGQGWAGEIPPTRYGAMVTATIPREAASPPSRARRAASLLQKDADASLLGNIRHVSALLKKAHGRVRMHKPSAVRAVAGAGAAAGKRTTGNAGLLGAGEVRDPDDGGPRSSASRGDEARKLRKSVKIQKTSEIIGHSPRAFVRALDCDPFFSTRPRSRQRFCRRWRPRGT